MKLLFLLLSTIAFCGAAMAFSREYDAAYLARSSDLAKFDALAFSTKLPQAPLSNRGMRELLMTCGAVRQGLLYALQPPEVKGFVDTNCIKIAKTALWRNPTYSAAHTIIMLSSHAPDAIAKSLIRSHRTAPLESWHAKLRLRKGLPLYGASNAAVDRIIQADISFLVQSLDGRAWLAKLYQSTTDTRPVIVKLIQARINAEQAAFLSEVEKLGPN